MVWLSDDPDRGANVIPALILNLDLLAGEILHHIPDAEVQVRRAVGEARSVLLSVWEGDA